MNNALLPVVVMIGGHGSNLQALIDNAGLDYQIVGVISHNPDAYGLTRAKSANIPTKVVDHKAYSTRALFEEALLAAVNNFHPKIIALAGFMRILSPDFIQNSVAPMLNVHPSLLPKYKGLHTHQRVLVAKEKEHGASIHFVTAELDGGPIIAQVKVPVLSTDTVEELTQRVHLAEHWLYPEIVRWFAQNRLKYGTSGATLDGIPLDPQGQSLQHPITQGTLS